MITVNKNKFERRQREREKGERENKNKRPFCYFLPCRAPLCVCRVCLLTGDVLFLLWPFVRQSSDISLHSQRAGILPLSGLTLAPGLNDPVHIHRHLRVSPKNTENIPPRPRLWYFYEKNVPEKENGKEYIRYDWQGSRNNVCLWQFVWVIIPLCVYIKRCEA